MTDLCRAPGCDKPRKRKSSLCSMHARRWDRYRSFDLPAREDWRANPCSVDDCPEPVHHRDPLLCAAHYMRLWRTGTPGGPVMRPHPCAAPGCDVTVWAEYCQVHYLRVRRYGTTELLGGPPVLSGPDNASWRGDDVTYGGAHNRLRKTLGPASAYPCVGGCGGAAAHWAFDHDSPNARPANEGPYSTNPDDYRPLCVPCHKTYDLAHRKASMA